MQISNDTVALITGGSNGIGKECADRILRQGGRVVLVDYDSKAGQVTTREFSGKYGNDAVMFIHCDVSDNKQLDDAFTSAVKKFGRLDIVFNNAGISEKTQWSEAIQSDGLPADWNSTIRIDLDAVINGTRLAVREMLKLNQKKSSRSSSSSDAKTKTIGVIINTASVAGLHPMPSPAYCAAKHGVVGFTRSCKMLSHQFGIRVNAICPSFADTNLVRNGRERSQSHAEYMALIQKMTGPLLTTGEVANAFDEIVKNERYAGSIISISQELGIAQHFVTPMSDQAKKTIQVIIPTSENRKLNANL